MVADTIIVDTKRILGPHKSSDPINVTVEGQESIFWIKSGLREIPGTTTKLILRKAKNPWDKMSEEEFIKSVEKVIPNPPFKINIETTKMKTIRDENSFNEVTAESLKDFSWKAKENIRTFEIPFNKKEYCFIGSAVIAILESQGKPIEKIELNSKEIEIEGSVYTLERNLTISENSIKENSKSITIDDDGEINENSSYSEYARSKSRISLHGIEIPTTLFQN